MKAITQSMMVTDTRHITQLSWRGGISALLKDEWELGRREGEAVHVQTNHITAVIYWAFNMCQALKMHHLINFSTWWGGYYPYPNFTIEEIWVQWDLSTLSKFSPLSSDGDEKADLCIKHEENIAVMVPRDERV